jgi:hypothetical protein
VIFDLHWNGIILDCDGAPDEGVFLRIAKVEDQGSLRVAAAYDECAETAPSRWISFRFDAAPGAQRISDIEIGTRRSVGEALLNEAPDSCC